MTTEQMDEVYDRRQGPFLTGRDYPGTGSTVMDGVTLDPNRPEPPFPGGIQVEHRATIRLPHPMPIQVLRRFAMEVPEGATVVVTTHTGGSQRDPETTGYSLVATW